MSITPGGNTVPGVWSAANGQLCIGTGGPQECVPYNGPMQASQPRGLSPPVASDLVDAIPARSQLE